MCVFGWTMSVWSKCMAKPNPTICTWLLGFYTTNRVSAILERYQPNMGGTSDRGSHVAVIRQSVIRPLPIELARPSILGFLLVCPCEEKTEISLR